MRFLADMGISPKVVDGLRARGHDAVHLWGLGLGTLSDLDILVRAREDGRLLLKADLDFGYLMAAGGDTLPSVVLFRLRDMSPANVGEQLDRVLARYSDELLEGLFVVVSDSLIRVRSLPLGRSSDQ